MSGFHSSPAPFAKPHSRAYCGCRRFFAHIRALTPWTYLLEKSCKHDFLSQLYPWVNCYSYIIYCFF